MAENRADTWMPFYWGDYRRDTSHLSTEEHGAYILLIGHYWTTGRPLPDDDGKLSRIAGLSAARWRKARQTLAELFRVADGAWSHKRIEEELTKAEARRAKYSAAGQQGANKRWGRNGETTSDANGNANGNATGTGDRVGENSTKSASQKSQKSVSPGFDLGGTIPSNNKVSTDGDVNGDANKSPLPTDSYSQSQSHSKKDSPYSPPRQRRTQPNAPADITGDFTGWYEAFPRHIGRDAALKAYIAARRRIDAETLLAGAKRYAAQRAGQDQQYTCHPATWLNQGRWADDAQQGAGKPPQRTPDQEVLM